MSKLFKATIETSASHFQNVIVTTQQISSDVNGNPRHSVQVWIDRKPQELEIGQANGNLWTPKVKGYRLTKGNCYIIPSAYYIEEDIQYFLEAFEKAVQA